MMKVKQVIVPRMILLSILLLSVVSAVDVVNGNAQQENLRGKNTISEEKISEKKPLPHQEFVAQYVKAYYIPESDLENWVKYHTEYSPKQLMALVNCVAYSNNKTKQQHSKTTVSITEPMGKQRRKARTILNRNPRANRMK